MQPSAQALGKKQGGEQAPKGRKKIKVKNGVRNQNPHFSRKRPREKWGTHISRKLRSEV